MATYIEYTLDDGTTILVQADEARGGGHLSKVSRDPVGNMVNSVNQRFEDAFAGVKKSAAILRQQLAELRADEVEVTFGLKAAGEFGNFAVGQVGGEANYTVKLKWNSKE